MAAGAGCGGTAIGAWAAARMARSACISFANHTPIARLEKLRPPAAIARMPQPIDVDLPHTLGKDEARRRIANNIHKLQEHIPGGAQVQSGWAGDQLNLDVAGVGQSVTRA